MCMCTCMRSWHVVLSLSRADSLEWLFGLCMQAAMACTAFICKRGLFHAGCCSKLLDRRAGRHRVPSHAAPQRGQHWRHWFWWRGQRHAGAATPAHPCRPDPLLQQVCALSCARPHAIVACLCMAHHCRVRALVLGKLPRARLLLAAHAAGRIQVLPCTAADSLGNAHPSCKATMLI